MIDKQKYQIVGGCSIDILEVTVNTLIDHEGWRPIGGIILHSYYEYESKIKCNRTMFYQAMFLQEK